MRGEIWRKNKTLPSKVTGVFSHITTKIVNEISSQKMLYHYDGIQTTCKELSES